MIKIDDTLVSDELIEKFFICDLDKCKGACCVEGDLGAPLEKEELRLVSDSSKYIMPYISNESKTQIKKQGHYVKDFEGDFSTPTINGRECVYAAYGENGILKCGFEMAWKDGKSEFRKPLSCHLYPIRIKNDGHNYLVNYDKWKICNPACKLGAAMNIPLYLFVKEALIRKFGLDWFNKLDRIAKKKLKNKKD